MPMVPTYRSNIQEQGLPNARLDSSAPIEAFGGGQAAKPADLGFLEVAGHIAAEEKNRFDQVNVQDYDTALSKLQTDLQVKSSQMRGKDAAGAMDFVQSEWEKNRADLDKMLNNDAQRAAGKRLSANRYESLYKAVNVHTATELQQYDTESTKSSVENSRNAAVLNYKDPGEIIANLDRQKAVLTDYARNNGKGEEWLQASVSENVSKTHSEIIQRMVNQSNDLMASNYYKNVKGQLTADDLVRVEKVLEEGSVRGESQRRADALLASGVSMQEALSRTKDIQDPKVRDATTTRIKEEFALRKTAEAADQERLFQTVSNVVEQTRNRDAIPVQQWLSLSLSQKEAIDNRIKQLNAGIEPPPNGPTYYKYKLMAVNPDTRNQFNATNLLEQSSQMTKSELNSLMDIQAKSREKDGATTDLLDYLDGNEKIKRETLSKVGINLTPHWYSFGGLDEKALVEFNASIDQAVKQKETAMGRKLVPEEMQEIANRFATEAVTSRNWIGLKTSKFVGNVTAEDVKVEDIPVDVRNSLASALKEKNWPVNDQNIIQFYIKGLKSGVIKPNGSQ